MRRTVASSPGSCRSVAAHETQASQASADAQLWEVACSWPELHSLCGWSSPIPWICLKSQNLNCCLRCAGIGGVFCRHGILMLALNLFTGEKWAYASLLICTMLLNYDVCPDFVWCVTSCLELLSACSLPCPCPRATFSRLLHPTGI